MIEEKRKTFSFKNLSPGQKNILAFIIVLCFVIQLFYLLGIRSIKLKNRIAAATKYGESVASSIIHSMDQCTSSTILIKDLYLEFGDDFIYSFDRVCSRLASDNMAIGSLYIAPKGVIQVAYPPKVFDSTIGFSMLEDPVQGPSAIYAKESRRITVGGPHHLVEGGTGFIVRNPVYVDDEFKAFTIVVVDWEEFVHQVISRVEEGPVKYNFAVWKKSNENSVIDENGFLFTNSGKNVSKLIDIPIIVPNDVWHLAVDPEKGWHVVDEMIFEIIFSIIFFYTVVVVAIIRMYKNYQKIYEIEHDSLTGLLTKSAFFSRAEKLLKTNPNKNFDILIADIENFKLINSIYGMAKGDEILAYLARSYETDDRQSFYGRYGGDSFISIFPSNDAMTLEDFTKKVERIIKNAPVKNISVNYGHYEKIDHNLDINIICDRALLAAKSIKRNYDKLVANYDGPVSKQHLRQQMLENSFEDAITNKEFKVWYQPKFDAKTEKLVGAEALVRWIQKDGTVISPGEFISIFENDGLIVRLDEYVFREVCNHIKDWINKGLKLVPVSINLSRTSLHHNGIISRYSEITKEMGISTEYVPLELTETATSSSIQIRQLTTDLKDAGFKIHMDDFGTGFSSLESLNILPFDVIKLDKSLIDYIGDPGGDEILRHTIEIAHFKKMHVVAEGVEQKAQLEFLKKLDCDYIQGYYYSAPKSYEKFMEYFYELMEQGKV